MIEPVVRKVALADHDQVREDPGFWLRRTAEERIAGKLAETFGDADALESIVVLRRAAAIIDDRRGLGGHLAKPDWSYQRGISRGCGSRCGVR